MSGTFQLVSWKLDYTNAKPDVPLGRAGRLNVHPDLPELQEFLSESIERLGLQNEFRDIFLQTYHLWYGLWARSPVSAPALRFLQMLLVEMRDGNVRNLKVSGEYPSLYDLEHLIGAIEVAREKEIPLLVELTPPGHIDFEIHTIFPHCPICKAAADLPAWAKRYPASYRCQTCGHEYAPERTSKRDDSD
ncbi:MAG TPA: hypothetical protein VFW23_17295 [Tepidisphaeraceae bacterium]|nr:hypothetical protein [Tepidisphaeraceae bacterium]